MDVIIFRFLIGFIVKKKLNIRLMDIMIAYLYGNFDKDIYMKQPKGFLLPEAKLNRHREVYFVKL